MSVCILDARSESKEWKTVLAQLPQALQDIYFQPEYALLHEFELGTRAKLFSYQRGHQLWVYSFLLREITHVGNHPLERTWFDIESPYGYGGPLANTEEPDFLEEAHRAFSQWCQTQGVVAEFVRLHPVLDNRRWLSPQVELNFDRQTVSLDLSTAQEDFPFLSSKTRNMLKRAEKLGVEVVSCSPQDHFDRFVEMYKGTMDRREADRYYYFGENYFAQLSELVQKDGWLLVAEQGKEWLAAAVFLKGSSYLHYHLSASNPTQRVPGAGNQLLCAAARMGFQSGLKRLHLGGGRTCSPDDSLLKFKQSLATDTHSFYIGKRIHNPQAYEHLRSLWSEQYPSLVPLYGRRVLCYRCGTNALQTVSAKG